MARDVIVPEAAKAAYDNFHFAQAVRSQGLVVCSGQIGTGADGKVPESAQEEFRNAWQAVGGVLKEAGLDYDNIVELTSFHVGLRENMGHFMKVKDEFVKEPYPAWSAIGITELAIPGARVEIRVVAAPD